MEALLLTQADRYDRLMKSYSNYRKSPKDRITVSYIESRMENLEKLWSRFDLEHAKILTFASEEKGRSFSEDYFTQDKFDLFEEMYTEYKSRLKDDLKKLNVFSAKGQVVEQSGTAVNIQTKLPQIHLPKFSGAYEEWQGFHDMFLSLIHHNKDLSAVQKLHYLKTSLTGEPDNLLKNLSTTATNYEEAWRQLIRRYNNKRYNVNEILKRLFSITNVVPDSATSIKHLLDSTSACLKSLNNLDIATDSWDVIINYLVVSKLDTESRKIWELQISQTESDELPTWDLLVRFLETRYRTLEMLDSGKQKVNHNANKQIHKQKSFHSNIIHEEKKKIACVMCPGQHLLYLCQEFQNQSPEQRSEFIQSKRLCFNCFSSSHSVKNCRLPTSCRKCGRRHHTLLHFERNQSTPAPTSVENSVPAESSSGNSEKRVTSHFATDNSHNNSEVLLATAIVRAVSSNGYSQIVRALIDQGSEASFITEATVQSLGLKRVPVSGLVSGVGEGETKFKSMVSLELESLHNPEFSVSVNAFVLSTLTSFLPSTNASISNWSEIENLTLADSNYGSPGRIDIILGVEVHSEIILSGLLRHPNKSGPIAQNTQFGWVLSGRIESTSSPKQRVVNLHIRVREDEFLKQFWEIEREPNMIQKRMTREEERCEEIYEKTTERDEDGRYRVRLPFKSEEPECLYGQSSIIARRRFHLLEKRLSRKPTLYDEYRKVMDDYVEQNHMVQINEIDEINKSRVVYLPHHPVVKYDKETTKVRVVYDASCKGVNNVSLNDTLMVGPKLQQDLRHILMRWRRHPICIAADLVQMYRQIRVHEEDTDFQRILWRADPEQPVKHYKLLRLTFGTSSAPYLAVKSLQQLAKDEQQKNPLAAKITLEDFYIDDLLTGCETEDEAVTIYHQLSNLMRAGGFHLQKWCTNCDKLKENIKQDCEVLCNSVKFKSNDTIKVLGICWSKSLDQFEYTYCLPEDSGVFTKRRVLSEIARLYDPLGWIAPLIVKAKIFIQRLWKTGLDWDDNLNPELLKEWLLFRDDLSNVRHIKIPRWLSTRAGDYIELHAFADASKAAYAAAVYIKVRDATGNIHVHLVTAKTKVAPVEKEISIPRLELCAALLATNLIFEVSQIMNVPSVSCLHGLTPLLRLLGLEESLVFGRLL